MHTYTPIWDIFFLLRKVIWVNFPKSKSSAFWWCEGSLWIWVEGWFILFPSLPSILDHNQHLHLALLNGFEREEMVDNTQGHWTLTPRRATGQPLRPHPEAACTPWGLCHLLPRQVAKEMGLCAMQSPTGAMCVAFACRNGRRLLHRLLSSSAKSPRHSGFCGFLDIWSVIKWRAVWERGIFQTSLYVPYFDQPFLWKPVGGLEVKDYIWLWNWWLIPLVSMETDERGKYIVLNKFNSYFLLPSTVALKNSKADTF